MRWRELGLSGNVGVELTLEDNGPGIANLEQVMQEGYTTSGGLGLGLPGSKRLMDEFEIASEIGKGTRITVRKWHRQL
jgi:serine/threonine-protein kinase RsbT